MNQVPDKDFLRGLPDDASVTNDFYYSWSFDDSLPYDHTVFHGDTEYALTEYNSRQYFVKTSDVTIR